MASSLPTIQTFADFERETLAFIKPPFKSKYGMLPWERLDEPGDEVEWLVPEFLTRGDKSIIGGPSASGKSFLAIDVGMAIARGSEFFGRTAKRGLVVYQAGEGARGIKNRLRAYRQHHAIPVDEKVPFVLLQSRVDLHSPDGDTKGLIDEITGICAHYQMPLAAFFIDTLARAMGGADENNGRDMGAILNNIDTIRDATKAHICLVHHLNADGTKLRGHTSVFANMDQVLSVICDAETKVRTLKLAKQKDESDDITIKFELVALKVGDRDGKDVTSCVVVQQGEKEKIKGLEGQRPFRPNTGEMNFLVALFRALNENGVAPPDNILCPSNVSKVVDFKHVREWFRRLNLNQEADSTKEQQRLSQAIKRAGDSLKKFQIIGVDENQLWHSGKVIYGIEQTYPRQNKAPKKSTNQDEDDDTLPL